jgi:hypothetical protein
MMKRCFVIGPIGPPGGEIRAAADDFIRYIVDPCMNELGYANADRADRLPEPGRITSQIIELLQSADLVIADLSGNNANVYYELSCRHAIGKSVIHMAVDGTLPAFDVADNRTIFYTMHANRVERAKEELTRQIKRVEEPGYKARNPILDAIGLITLEKSTEPTQQAIAALVRAVESLRGDVGIMKLSQARILAKPDVFGAQLSLAQLLTTPVQVTAYHPAVVSGTPLGLGLAEASKRVHVEEPEEPEDQGPPA